MNISKEDKIKLLEKDPSLVSLIESMETNSNLSNINQSLSIFTEFVNAFLKQTTQIKGEPGKKGEPGISPVKGIDYYTEIEKQEFIDRIIDLIPDIIKVENGYTPQKGVDYFTDSELKDISKSIIKDVLKGIKVPKAEKVDYNKITFEILKSLPKVDVPDEETTDSIANKLNKKEEILNISVIKGYKDLIRKEVVRFSKGISQFRELTDVDLNTVTYNPVTKKYEFNTGGGGGGTWGSITGTLSDQTDLQNALDDKIPFDTTGNLSITATGSINLDADTIVQRAGSTYGVSNNGGTTIQYFDTKNQTTDRITSFPDRNGTPVYSVNEVDPDPTTGNVTVQQVHLRVKANSDLTKGMTVRYVGFNAGEQAIEIDVHDDLTVPCIGVLKADLLTGEFADIMVVIGKVSGIDTSAFANGDILYSDGAGGFLINPVITFGNFYQPLAYVVRSNAINGEIMVNVNRGHDNAYLISYDGTEANVGDMLSFLNDNKQNNLFDFSANTNVIFNEMMVNNSAWMLPTEGVATYGNLFRNRGPITLGGNTASSDGTPSIRFLTTTTPGNVATQRATSMNVFSQFILSKQFEVPTTTSDTRFFTGVSAQFLLSAPTNVDPTTLINCIGVGKIDGSQNLQVIWNDATGLASTFDLGSSYPANSNLYRYSIIIRKLSASEFTIYVQRKTISTGATIVTSYTATTNVPTTSSLSTFHYITNNASSTAVELKDYGSYAPYRIY